MWRNEKGFSVTVGLIILVVIGVIGLTGWYVWSQSSTNNTQAPQTAESSESTKTKQDDYAGWKAYCDNQKIACLKHPADWAVNEQRGESTSIQFLPPASGPKNVNVDLRLGGACTKDTTGLDPTQSTQNEYDLTTPLDNLKVKTYIIHDHNAPGIELVGSGCITRNNSNVNLSAVPTDLPYSSNDQATSWLSSEETKTALQIIQSFSFQ